MTKKSFFIVSNQDFSDEEVRESHKRGVFQVLPLMVESNAQVYQLVEGVL